MLFHYTIELHDFFLMMDKFFFQHFQLSFWMRYRMKLVQIDLVETVFIFLPVKPALSAFNQSLLSFLSLKMFLLACLSIKLELSTVSSPKCSIKPYLSKMFPNFFLSSASFKPFLSRLSAFNRFSWSSSLSCSFSSLNNDFNLKSVKRYRKNQSGNWTNLQKKIIFQYFLSFGPNQIDLCKSEGFIKVFPFFFWVGLIGFFRILIGRKWGWEN